MKSSKKDWNGTITADGAEGGVARIQYINTIGRIFTVIIDDHLLTILLFYVFALFTTLQL
jgi:hypothetical protein